VQPTFHKQTDDTHIHLLVIRAMMHQLIGTKHRPGPTASST